MFTLSPSSFYISQRLEFIYLALLPGILFLSAPSCCLTFPDHAVPWRYFQYLPPTSFYSVIAVINIQLIPTNFYLISPILTTLRLFNFLFNPSMSFPFAVHLHLWSDSLMIAFQCTSPWTITSFFPVMRCAWPVFLFLFFPPFFPLFFFVLFFPLPPFFLVSTNANSSLFYPSEILWQNFPKLRFKPCNFSFASFYFLPLLNHFKCSLQASFITSYSLPTTPCPDEYTHSVAPTHQSWVPFFKFTNIKSIFLW